jgi:hypothetical protein
VEAAVESAMEENDLKAVLVRITQNGEEVATVNMVPSDTRVISSFKPPRMVSNERNRR